MSSPWITALHHFNEGKRWTVPKRGTPEHAQVLEIAKKLAAKPASERPAQQGAGLKEIVSTAIDYGKKIKDAIQLGKRKGLSPSFRATFVKNQNKTITHLAIVREPVQAVLKTIINVITLGKFNNQIKNLQYDDVYHLRCVIQLSDGTRLLLEKNAVPELRPLVPADVPPTADRFLLNARIPFKKFIEGTIAKIGMKNYVEYDASSLNCQKFIVDHLESNNLINQDLRRFIMQDAANLLSQDPNIIKALKSITDVGALADVVIHGRGIGDEIAKFFKQLFSLFKRPEYMTSDQIWKNDHDMSKIHFTDYGKINALPETR